MTSNLVIEDGSIISGANSYVSAADLRTYALLRGVTLATNDSPGDALVDQMAIKAMDYVEMNRSSFWGWRVSEAQRLSFPREGVPIDDERAGSDFIINGRENLTYAYRDASIIPPELIEAQCQLVMQVKVGVDLVPTQAAGKFLTRQKIGPIEREFSEAIGLMVLPRMPAVDALLKPLVRPRGTVTAFRR